MKKKIEQFTFRGDVYNAYLEISDDHPSPLGLLYGKIMKMELFHNNSHILSFKNGEFDKSIKDVKRIRAVVEKIATKYSKINVAKLNFATQSFLQNNTLINSDNPNYKKLITYIWDKVTIRNAAIQLNKSEDEFMPKPVPMTEKEMINIAYDVKEDLGIIEDDEDMFDKYYVDRYALICEIYNKGKCVPYDCVFVSVSKPRDNVNHIYMVYEDNDNKIHVFYLGPSMNPLFQAK